MNLGMTRESKLSIITMSAVVGPILFAYFTYSANRWINRIEVVTEKVPIIEERVLRQDQGMNRIENKLDLVINKLAKLSE